MREFAYLFIQFTANHFSVTNVSTNTISFLVRINQFLLAINVNSNLWQCCLDGLRSLSSLRLLARFGLSRTHAHSSTAILTCLCDGTRRFSLAAASCSCSRSFRRRFEGGSFANGDSWSGCTASCLCDSNRWFSGCCQ